MRIFLLLLLAAVSWGATVDTPDLGTGSTPASASTSADSNKLEGKTWEAPGTIGSTTPNTGAFTTLSTTGSISTTNSTGPLVHSLNILGSGGSAGNDYAEFALSDLSGQIASFGILDSSYPSGGLYTANGAYFIAGPAASGGLTVATESATPIMFATSSTEAFRVNAAGRVLVATAVDNGVDTVQIAGSVSISTPLAIAYGGTASSTAATARAALGVSIYDFPMMLEAATVKIYYLLPASNVAYTINNMYAGDVSGTATIAVKINGTSVTGLSAVAVTSTPGTTNATALNTVAAGDTVTIVVTAASTPIDLFLNVKMTR